MIKLCIFDLDGTILSTLTTITHYVNETLQKYGLSPISEAECSTFVGNGARKLITCAAECRGVSGEVKISEMFSCYNAAYNASPYYLTEVYPGIRELIDALKERGIALAVLSNKPDFATRATVSHFFGDSFDMALGGREGIPLKPDAESAAAIFSHFGVLPTEVAFIGDSEVDVTTAKNIGAALGIAVSWGLRDRKQLLISGAEHIAESPDEVLKMIDKYNKLGV